MRCINIISHSFASKFLREETLKDFSAHESLRNQDNVRISEEEDLRKFTKYLKSADFTSYDNFFYSYKIPQISKEFDLLRVGQDTIINIEIKRYSDEEKIKNQLLRNQYYLSFIDKKNYLFCFIAENEQLYYLSENNTLECSDRTFLLTLIDKQKCNPDLELDDLFKPSNYLVSPFNKTEEFISNKYFLTSQQENYRTDILKTIKNAKQHEFIKLEGGAGSGKTLLTFDIAKTLMNQNNKVAIIHCGELNEGHNTLKSTYKWSIYPIYHYKNILYDNLDILIIDEGQRIDFQQFASITSEIIKNNIKCLFSFDPLQILSSKEANSSSLDLANRIATKQLKLSGKIRTNKEITYFIRNLFNLEKTNHSISYPNIYVSYYPSYKNASGYIKHLTAQGWNFINYTPSRYKEETFECLNCYQIGVAHSVIGQEFDNIVAVLDEKFYYENNILMSHSLKSNYSAERMFFQAITRTREKLHIVIINNEQLLENCLKILNRH